MICRPVFFCEISGKEPDAWYYCLMLVGWSFCIIFIPLWSLDHSYFSLCPVLVV